MGKAFKKIYNWSFLAISLLVLASPVFADSELINAEVLSKTKTSITVSYPEPTVKDGEVVSYKEVKLTIPMSAVAKDDPITSNMIKVGDQVSFEYDADTKTFNNVAFQWKNNAEGFSNDPWEKKPIHNKLFGTYCAPENALNCWVGAVFNWSLGAILLLSTGVVVFAGVTYMTSGGNPQRMAMAKKLIIGALSGVGVMVLGRFFLTKVVGVPWL